MIFGSYTQKKKGKKGDLYCEICVMYSGVLETEVWHGFCSVKIGRIS